MLKNKFFLFYLFLLVLFGGTACTSRESKVDINNIPSVEVHDFVDPTDFFLIPLETNDQSLIGSIQKIVVGKENLFILSNQSVSPGLTTSRLLMFNKDGTFSAKIGTVGQGPGEYLGLDGFDIDDETHTIHLLDSNLKKVLVYNYDGGFIREWTMSNDDTVGDDIVVLNNLYAFMNGSPKPVTEEISVTNMQGKAQHKYLPRSSEKYSMVPMSDTYYFFKMNGEAYFVPFCDDRIFKLDAEGNLKMIQELGLRPVMFPLETNLDEITMKKGTNRLAPIGDFVINDKGQYCASTYSHNGSIDIFGDIHKSGIIMRTFYGDTKNKPDLTFAMEVVGADGDYFIGRLDASSALESYPELKEQNINDQSNPVLVYFKFLPKTFEN